MAEKELVQQMHVAHHLHNRLVFIEFHASLAIEAYFQGFAAFDDAAELPVFRDVAGQDVQERGFAGAVLADYADAFEPLEIIREMVQIDIRSIAETHVLTVNYLVSEP